MRRLLLSIITVLTLTSQSFAFGFGDDAWFNAENVNSGAVPILHMPLSSDTAITRGTGSATFTRASTQYGTNSVGELIQYATNVPAFNGNPAYSVSTWGDSMSAAGSGYATQLAANLVRYTVSNGGVGGETSTQIKNRMLAAVSQYGDTTIIWAGRNNYADGVTVLSDIASMVAVLGHNRYVVISVFNGSYGGYEIPGGGGYTLITDINNALATTYPNNYLDARAYIVDQYDSGIPQDILDHTNDTPPTSLRTDAIHLNATGSGLVADYVTNFIRNKGWLTNKVGGGKGIFLEPAATNSLSRSEDFGSATWIKAGVQAAGSGTILGIIMAPTGFRLADKIAETASTAVHYVTQPILSLTGTFTFSVYAKAAERTFIQLTEQASTAFRASFNLSNGTVANSAGAPNATIINAGDGWYRCSISAPLTNQTFGATIGISTDGTLGVPSQSYAGDGTSGVYVWQAQLESGPTATSPIVTTTTSVTRAATVLSVPLDLNFNNARGSAYIEYTPIADVGFVDIIGNGTIGPIIAWANNDIRPFDGTNYYVGIGTLTTGVTHKLAAAWGDGVINMTRDGLTPGTFVFDGSFDIVDTLFLGKGANGYIRNVKTYNKKLTNSELERKTR